MFNKNYKNRVNRYLQKIWFIPGLFLTTEIAAQNIAINTTGVPPVNNSVLLDLSNNLTNGTTGFLAPYTALTASNASAPLIAPPAGLIVYNTATAGVSPNNVIPGYYYWNGSQWQLIVTGSGSSSAGWTVMGNVGVTASTSPIGTLANNNFIGTTTAADFVVAANGYEVIRIANSTGNVGVSNIAPTTLMQIGNGGSTGKLSVYSQDFQFGQVQIGNPTSNAEASLQFISGVNAFGSSATSINGYANMWNIGAGTYFKGGTKFIISNVSFGEIMTFTSAGLTGIGATSPNRELEVGGTTNTIRIGGLATAGTFYSTNTAPTAASSVMFANNTNGDVQALAPSATNGQVLTQTATGPAWQSMEALNNVVVLTTSGTYTPSAGTKNIFVRMLGGGGGGVAATVHASTEDALAAGGGGAGGYCELFIAGVVVSYPVTIGTAGAGGAAGANPGGVGGSTAFGAVTVGGGAGGSGCAATAGIFFTTGGAGGAAVLGTFNIQGGAGANGVIYVNSTSPAACAGVGGSSPLGQGGVAPYITNNAVAGNSGAGYGSGGSGAISTLITPPDNASAAGGSGTAGVIIIYEYK